MLATNFLRDDAAQCRMHTMLAAKRANQPVTWSMFTTCLQNAYGLPPQGAHSSAPIKKKLRQRTSSAHDYVQHATTLLNRIQTDLSSNKLPLCTHLADLGLHLTSLPTTFAIWSNQCLHNLARLVWRLPSLAAHTLSMCLPALLPSP